MEKSQKPKLFGTDGVRGVANVYPMTSDVALRLGMAAAEVFSNGNKRTRILIGKDTRISGYMLEYSITAGLVSMGADVLLVGPMPTPAIAHLTKSFAADAGIVISASHNPSEDNGIKFFDNNGFKLSKETEDKIEKLVLKNDFNTSLLTGKNVGKAKRIDDASGRYIEFAKGSIQNMSLKGLKIVLDCANGAAYKIAPLIFEELGADLIIMNNSPDGLNINKNSGALHPEVLSKEVKKLKANVGIALDGDADRIIMVDENGEILDGDEIIAIISKEFLKAGILKNKNVVTTVMSNIGFELSMKKMGIEVIRTDVGDKYVSKKMREENVTIGGEQSGHIILSDYATTGDGVISGLQILSIMQKTKQKLSTLKKIMKKYPQVMINVKVTEKKSINKMKDVEKTINEIEKELGKDGRILVRYSGTENKCRIMIEGKNQKHIESLANKVADKIKKEIGSGD